jgi:hypothetical protein
MGVSVPGLHYEAAPSQVRLKGAPLRLQQRARHLVPRRAPQQRRAAAVVAAGPAVWLHPQQGTAIYAPADGDRACSWRRLHPLQAGLLMCRGGERKRPQRRARPVLQRPQLLRKAGLQGSGAAPTGDLYALCGDGLKGEELNGGRSARQGAGAGSVNV